MATNDARMPFIRMSTSTHLRNAYENAKAEAPPPTEAFRVTIAERAAYFHLSPDTPNIDPQLKPSQPHLQARRATDPIRLENLEEFTLSKM